MCSHIFGVYKYHASTSKCEMMANFEEEKEGNVREIIFAKGDKKMKFPLTRKSNFFKNFLQK